MGNCEVKNNHTEIKKEKKNYQRRINKIKDVHIEELKINTIQYVLILEWDWEIISLKSKCFENNTFKMSQLN